MANDSAPNVGRVANVGDRIKTFHSYASPGDVDAILRNQFFVTRQVDGRDGVLRAVTASAPGVPRMQNGRASRCRARLTRPAVSSLRIWLLETRFAAQRHLADTP